MATKTEDAEKKAAAIDPALKVYLWAASCAAIRETDDSISALHFPSVIVAANGSEAQELAWRYAFERYPEEDGWEKHSVSLEPIPAAFIQRASR